MKKLIIALIVLGLIVIGVSVSNADNTRTMPHKYRTFSADTSVGQGATIFRIMGYTTGSSATYGIFNSATIVGSAATNAAVEGGEATSGDALTTQYFGEEGLSLNAGMSVKINSCVLVIEYL